MIKQKLFRVNQRPDDVLVGLELFVLFNVGHQHRRLFLTWRARRLRRAFNAAQATNRLDNLFGDILTCRRWRQRFAVTLEYLNPLLDDLA